MRSVEVIAAKLSRDVYLPIDAFHAKIQRYGVGIRIVDWMDHAGSQVALVQADDAAFLVFRGTEASSLSLLDIAADLKIVGRPWAGDGWAHDGFADALERVRYPARRLAEQVASHIPLYVTGHSLGGALAVLYGAWVTADERFGHRIAGVITFGCPRSATGATFAALQSHNALLRRFAVRGDVVPHLPPLIYKHPCAPVTLPGPSWLAGPLRRHSMDWYVQSVERWSEESR